VSRIDPEKSLASYRDCLGGRDTGTVICSGRAVSINGELKEVALSAALWSLSGFPFAISTLKVLSIGASQRKNEPELLYHSAAAYHGGKTDVAASHFVQVPVASPTGVERRRAGDPKGVSGF
jgi:hypothetical protein